MSSISKIEINNKIKAEINITPNVTETPTYGDLTKAFKNITMAINEVVYSATYLADGGFSSSAVVGAAPTVTLTGDFIKGDEVCEYLDSIQYEIGESRVTDIKLTRNDKIITCPVTLTGIAIAGGESTAPNTVTLTIAFNGKPLVTNEE